jgi:DNA-binding transcriptional ArsR family regulator
MAEENFLLVSLKEDEAKRLAQVISNDTSRRIIDLLAGRKDATETDIAKHLGLPLSTVHYNLHALVQAKLVQADEFHYSQKGKEVNHYSLANKYVIIAPKDAPESLRSKLRRILPVAVLSLAGAGLVQLLFRAKAAIPAREILLSEAAPMLAKSADATVAGAQEALIQAPVQPWFATNFAMWFLYGAIFAIVAFVVVDWIQRKK